MALLLGLAGCAAAEPAPPAERPHATRVAAAQQRDLVQRTSYVGTVRSAREVKIIARLPGILEALPVAEGEAVRRGAIIARIAAPEMLARLDQARAELSRVTAERDYACETFATDERLLERRAISATQVDNSRRQCRSAEAAARAAAARAQEVEGQLGDRVERAPFDGTVLDHLAEPGEYVTPGRPLVLIGDGALELEVLVSEGDVLAQAPARAERGVRESPGGIGPGTSADVALPGGRFSGQVASVAPRAEGAARSVRVRIPLPPDAGARHGMSLDVDFVLARATGASAVPAEAILRKERGAALFLVEDDVVRRREVEVGITDAGWVEVRPALPADARVAVSNLEALRDGAAIYPVLVDGARR